MENYVVSTLRAQRIRKDARATKKQLVEAADEAKRTLVELMLAAGVDSVKGQGEYDYFVLKERSSKKCAVSSDAVQDVLSNLKKEDLFAAAQSGTPPTFLEAVKNHVLQSIEKGDGGGGGADDDDDDDESPSYTLAHQLHAPLRHAAPPSAEAEQTLRSAAEAYRSADLRKRAFDGKIKEMLTDVRAGVSDATELDVVDFIRRTTADTARSADSFNDGKVMFTKVEASLLSPSAAEVLHGSGGGGVFLKAEKKRREKKIAKKRFLEIVNSVLDASLEARFGGRDVTIDDSHVAEVARQSVALSDAIDDRVESVSAQGEVSVVVTLSSKKPRVAR